MRFGERQAEDDDTPAKGHWAKRSFLIARRTSYFGPFLTSKTLGRGRYRRCPSQARCNYSKILCFLRGRYIETCALGAVSISACPQGISQDGRTERKWTLSTPANTHNTSPAGLPTTNIPCSKPLSITNMPKTLIQPFPISTQALKSCISRLPQAPWSLASNSAALWVT